MPALNVRGDAFCGFNPSLKLLSLSERKDRGPISLALFQTELQILFIRVILKHKEKYLFETSCCRKRTYQMVSVHASLISLDGLFKQVGVPKLPDSFGRIFRFF